MVKMISHCLNPNIVLNLCTAVVLQSMITFIINSLFIKILLGCFFCSSTSSNQYFLWFEMYFIVVIWKFYNLILFLYVLHWTTVFHHCLIVILYHFYMFVCLYQPYSNSTGFSGFFISSFISLYSFNALFTETNSSWLIIMTNIWVD